MNDRLKSANRLRNWFVSASMLLGALVLIPARSHAIERLPLPADFFQVAEAKAFVMEPGTPGPSRPWVWYAPTLPQNPKAIHGWYFRQLLERGVAVAGVNLGEVRGAPASTERFQKFYEEMVRRGYSRRPVLLGQSRGGLMLLAWAMRHPENVSAFAGIYPVCNLLSWPLKQSKAKTLADYGLDEVELRKRLAEFNPIDNLAPLAARRVSVFLMHGDSDQLVPWQENGALLMKNYQSVGGTVETVLVPKLGHEEVAGFFESKALLEFLLAHS